VVVLVFWLCSLCLCVWLCLLCLCVCWPACLLFVIGLMSTLLTCNLASVKQIFSFCVILVVGARWVLLLVCLVFGMCVVLGLSFALWCKSASLSWIVSLVAAPPLFWGSVLVASCGVCVCVGVSLSSCGLFVSSVPVCLLACLSAFCCCIDACVCALNLQTCFCPIFFFGVILVVGVGWVLVLVCLVVCVCGGTLCFLCFGILLVLCGCHRSHFGSRYTLGFCGHTGP